MRNEIVNAKVRIIPHSRRSSFHHATAVKAVRIGILIFSNFGQVSKPRGSSSRYGVPGILLTQQQLVSIA